jgi:hypothetical protein
MPGEDLATIALGFCVFLKCVVGQVAPLVPEGWAFLIRSPNNPPTVSDGFVSLEGVCITLEDLLVLAHRGEIKHPDSTGTKWSQIKVVIGMESYLLGQIPTHLWEDRATPTLDLVWCADQDQAQDSDPRGEDALVSDTVRMWRGIAEVRGYEKICGFSDRYYHPDDSHTDLD